MYESLSLIELKRLAKTQKIKQYYILKRDDLLKLLNMEKLPLKYKLEKMTMTELRNVAKERGMRGFWVLSKKDLTDKLFPSNDQQEYDSQTSKHRNP